MAMGEFSVTGQDAGGLCTQARVERLLDLLEACSYLSSSLDMQTTLTRIGEVVKKVLDAAESSIMLLDDKRKVLSFYVVSGEKGQKLMGMEIPVGEGIAGHVAQTRRPLLVADCSSDPNFAARFDRVSGFVTRSLLCVPLIAQGEVVGVMEAVNKQAADTSFNEEDMDMALSLAHVAAAAIVNARLYAELRDTQADMVLAGKLAALGTMASGIAHELNQPLTGILGFVQLLLRKARSGMLDGAEAQRHLEFVERQVRRMTHIINHMRTFAHPSPTESGSVELNRVIEDALTLVQGQMNDNRVRISLALDPALPSIAGDAGRLEEVVINLLANASEAVLPKDEPSREILVATRALEDQQGVQMQIRDRGTGILPENLPRIFDPFFTTRPRGKGTGLGLSLSYRIVRDHGGTIEVESAMGEGTTFSVLLPLTDGRPPEVDGGTGKESNE